MAVTRGFRGRQPDSGEPRDRVPPGQYVTHNFPVLSAGPTQQTRVEKWVRRLVFMATNAAGFRESLGYHIHGDPWREQRHEGDT